MAVTPDVSYRRAEPADVAAIQAVEVAAGQLFLSVGMPEIAADPPPRPDALLALIHDSGVWAATDAKGAVIAYLTSVRAHNNIHIEQLSVDPAYSRRRIGAGLIDLCCMQASSSGAQAATLFTFAEVPWNAPYYRRLGFTDLNESDLDPQLSAIWAAEHAAGLQRWRRVALIRQLPATSRAGRIVRKP